MNKVIEKIANIESAFINLRGKDNDFPVGKDCINLYEILKEKFVREIHPEIKTKILEIEQEGYFNDHGVEHINMVIERATWLLNKLEAKLQKAEGYYFISPYEVFILLMAIQLHDTGHLISSRKEHAAKGKELLAIFDSGNLLSTAEKKIIGDIAKAHGGKDDPISKLERTQSLSNKTIRPQMLAAILRLADELSEDKTRASDFLLKNNFLAKTSKIFHLYSSSLDSVDINGDELKLVFYLNELIAVEKYPIREGGLTTDKYLIDEIYDRTYKTFTESLYCSRFLPENGRISCVKVDIYILSSKNHDEIKRISFEIKERGYPFMTKNDFFEVCKPYLIDGDRLIDGEYIKEKVENYLIHESV